MRPIENRGLLIGLACAFVDLQDAIASSIYLLSSGSRVALEQIARRERECFEFCLEELRHLDEERYHEACRGFCIVRTKIENSFDQIDSRVKGFEVGIQ